MEEQNNWFENQNYEIVSKQRNANEALVIRTPGWSCFMQKVDALRARIMAPNCFINFYWET